MSIRSIIFHEVNVVSNSVRNIYGVMETKVQVEWSKDRMVAKKLGTQTTVWWNSMLPAKEMETGIVKDGHEVYGSPFKGGWY